MMRQHLVTFLCLVLASILYVAGMSSDAQGMVVVGMCFEGIFWTRVFRKRRTVQLSSAEDTKY